MMRLLLSAAAAFFLLLPSAADAVQPTPETPARQAEILREAGVTLPERVGSYALDRVFSVAPGRAAGSYRSQSGGLIDIFVAPALGSAEEELAASEAAIGRIFRDVRRVRPLTPPPSAAGAIGLLWSAESARGPVATAAMVWQRRGWRLKLRASVPAAAGDAAVAEIEAFIRDFGWN
jgi:hypothetical protein